MLLRSSQKLSMEVQCREVQGNAGQCMAVQGREVQCRAVHGRAVHNRSSHLGIHKQTNACWSIPRSQTVFYQFKICRRSAESGNYEAFVLVDCWQLQ